MSIQVVNKKTRKRTTDDIYIGRGSYLGNPYTSLKLSNTRAQFQASSREESIRLYELYLIEQLNNENVDITNAIKEIILKSLKDEVYLSCFCSPLPCHGDVIKKICDNIINNGFLKEKFNVLFNSEIDDE